MDVQEDADEIQRWMSDTMDAAQLSLPVGERECPHCGLKIRYPIIVRRSDIVMFTRMMNTAQKIMQKYGIQAALLSEIKISLLSAKKPKGNKPQ